MSKHAARRERRRAIVPPVVLALIVMASAVFLVSREVSAANSAVTGKPVPAEYRASVTAAGTACSALSPARVAAQIMAVSGFEPTATTDRGGRGLAGLTVAEWNQWKPTATATRTDGAANILALAHMTCDAVGHLRVAKLPGDLWPLAVAALYTSGNAVIAARGVPASAQAHVSTVADYATYYEQQGNLGSPAAASPSPSLAPSPSPSAAPSASPLPLAAPALTPHAGPPTSPVAPRTAPTTTGPVTIGQFRNAEAHGCLSAVAAVNGSHLAVATCDGSAVQRWQELPDGTIHSVGLCMDLSGANLADFSQMQVANCSGNPAQLWRVNGQSQIYSSYANKCVNIDYRSDGPAVLDYSCVVQGNQLFVFESQ